MLLPLVRFVFSPLCAFRWYSRYVRVSWSVVVQHGLLASFFPKSMVVDGLDLLSEF